MQRKLTIALAATALVSIVLVGFGVLTIAQFTARGDAEDGVKRGLSIVEQFLDNQERTVRGVDQLLGNSRRNLGLDSLAAGLVNDRGELRAINVRGPGRGALPGAQNLPDVTLDQDQRTALDNGETVLINAGDVVIGLQSVPNLRVDQLTEASVVVVGSRRVSAVSGRTLAWFIGSSVLVILGAVVAGAVLARRLAKPLSEMKDTTEAIASGDLSARVDNLGTDEVADLGQAVNRMAEDLQRSKALDRQFLMSVSHDLKTPLTAITGYAEALSDGAAADPKAAGDIIKNHAGRLSRLVGDLLDLAKLDANRFRFNTRAFDLGVVAGRTVAGQTRAAERHGLTIRVDGLSSIMVNADADRTAQAVDNLIDNAIKFASSEVLVEVRAETAGPGRWAIVAVRDDGPGIPQADLDHVFDRLYTGAAQPKRAENPTGLGLAIVRELVNAMGGQVVAANHPDGGASLSLALPLVEGWDVSVAGDGAEAATGPPAAAEAGPPGPA